jgi:putative DNA primase/helicase
MDLLPEAFRPWIEDAAERLQCPPEFIAVPAMVAAGSAVGRRCAIRPKRRDDWLVVPNVWGAIVGRPSTMKSPAIGVALGPIRKAEADAARAHVAAAERHAQEMERYADIKAAAKSVRKQAAKAALKKGLQPEDLPEQEPPPPPPRAVRFLTNDSTYEAAGEIMAENPNGILVVRDEIVGFLRPLDREEYAAARGFWLESWNGLGGYTFDRIGRGTVRLEAVCAGLVGGLQPARLAQYVKDATQGGAGDDGLLQRFGLLVWPDGEPEWRDVDRYPDNTAKRQATAIYQRLVAITPEAIAAHRGEFDEVPWLGFDEGGQEVFAAWHANLERRLRAEGLHPAIESHLAKYRKLVPALALISHLADSPDGGPVTEDAALAAVAWSEYLEPHAIRIYGAASLPERAAARLIWARREALPSPFSARDVQRRGWVGMGDADAVARALSVLEDHCLILGEAVVPTAAGGRPSVRYTINPRAAGL